MRLNSLKLQNFLSFDELSLQFKDGLFLIDGFNYDDNTANGAGKSAILDAIVYAIYGKTPRNTKLDDFIKWDKSSETLFANLILEDGNNIIEIYRSRSPDKVVLKINDKEYTDYKDVTELNSKIERLVGLSYYAFLSAVYFNQDRKDNFIYFNDEQKKDLLTELLGLNVFDNLLEDTKSDLVKVNYKLEECRGQEVYTQKLIDKVKEDIKDYENLKKQQATQQEQQKTVLDAKIKNYQKMIVDNVNKVAELEREAENINVVETEIKSLEDRKVKLAKINDDINELSFNSKQLEKVISELEKQKKEYEDFLRKGVCYTCGQKIHEEDRMKKLIKDAESKISNYTQERTDKIKQKIALEKLYEKHNNIESKLKAQNELLNKIKSSGMLIKELKSKNGLFEKEIEQLNKERSEVKNTLDNTEQYKVKKENELKDLEKQLKDNILNRQDLEKEFSVLAVLKEAFSKTGIKAQVFTQIMFELNEAIQKYTTSLFDNNVSLYFDNITENKSKGKITDKISTHLTVNSIEVPFGLLSGGQKKRLVLATDFALAEIVSRRNSHNFDFIILDEAFDGLDSNSKAKVMQFLEDLKQKKKQIFCIDHAVEMKSMFDFIMFAEYKNKSSTLKVA